MPNINNADYPLHTIPCYLDISEFTCVIKYGDLEVEETYYAISHDSVTQEEIDEIIKKFCQDFDYNVGGDYVIFMTKKQYEKLFLPLFFNISKTNKEIKDLKGE